MVSKYTIAHTCTRPKTGVHRHRCCHPEPEKSSSRPTQSAHQPRLCTHDFRLCAHDFGLCAQTHFMCAHDQLKPWHMYSSRQKLQSRDRYVTKNGRVYHARMAKALDVHGCIPTLQRRMERYYDKVCVDEVQDFGGHDFTLLKQIVQANVEVLLVGDFYQHTYSTSADGAVNKGLHDSYECFKNALRSAGLIVDTTSLLKSHRCSATVCSFIREKIGVDIYADSERTTKVSVVSEPSQAEELHSAPGTIKLFYQEHNRYGCYSQTWGNSKGRDHYQDVCVVLNAESWKRFSAGTLAEMAAISRNKLYVACSRARGDLHVMPDTLLKAFKKARDVRHAASA